MTRFADRAVFHVSPPDPGSLAARELPLRFLLVGDFSEQRGISEFARRRRIGAKPRDLDAPALPQMESGSSTSRMERSEALRVVEAATNIPAVQIDLLDVSMDALMEDFEDAAALEASGLWSVVSEASAAVPYGAMFLFDGGDGHLLKGVYQEAALCHVLGKMATWWSMPIFRRPRADLFRTCQWEAIAGMWMGRFLGFCSPSEGAISMMHGFSLAGWCRSDIAGEAMSETLLGSRLANALRVRHRADSARLQERNALQAAVAGWLVEYTSSADGAAAGLEGWDARPFAEATIRRIEVPQVHRSNSGASWTEDARPRCHMIDLALVPRPSHWHRSFEFSCVFEAE